MTRAEHMRWCKERAREYLNGGDAKEAVASMLSDLTKHPETADLVQGPLGMLGALSASNLEEARRFVEGFAE